MPWPVRTRLRRLPRRMTIRARVTVVAALLGIATLGLLGYLQLATMSQAFTRATNERGLTIATQLSQATTVHGTAVAKMVPFTPDDLDGVAIFDRRGRVKTAGGRLAPAVMRLGRQARAVARTRRSIQEFRRTSGRTPSGLLTPRSPADTIQVTVVPQGEGALAAGFHVAWATSTLRSTAQRSLLGLTGGAMFLCFTLLLILGRLVTTPVGRLAADVRRLGEGGLEGPLPAPPSPELEQLASDISRMHGDLTGALRESATDPLTGVANHRAFHERLDRAVEESRRSGSPLALVAFDLDNLKPINDRWGHVAGDRVIAGVAAEMAALCREGDLCARVGGDEFSLVLPGTDRATAAAIGDRVVAAVGRLSLARLVGVPDGDDLGLSVSVGIADMPAGAATKEQLIERADRALYDSKFAAPENGRGRPRARHSRDATAAASAHGPGGGGASEQDAATRALALAATAGAWGPGHGEAVAGYAAAIAARMGAEQSHVAAVRRAGLLHDLGLIDTPDAIVGKPGPLTPEERDRVQGHSSFGYRVIRAAALPAQEALWVLHHHEHFDGSGYPHGLRGTEIPLEARILLAADAYEAMVHGRPHRAARTPREALAELRRCAGTQFDPVVVEALATTLEQTELAEGRDLRAVS